MSLFCRYLRQHRRVIGVMVLFSVIFAVTFRLYALPVQAVAYPACLCGLIGIILMIVDFLRVRSKHRQLSCVTGLADLTAGLLPKAEGVAEQDYQQILMRIAEEQGACRMEEKRRYADMVDYYTLWAHQVKTPIASMRLHMQNEDSELSRSLTGDLFRVEQYVDMVLMFLKLEGDGSDYLIKSYDLDGIIRRAVKKFAGEFISRRLSLCYEPVHATVLTDEKWLSFVIEQILSNALKYTPSGSIRITLEPDRKLCIRDTGIGIAPEDLPRIFENGYTGFNGRTHMKASGIGLYLCKRICDNLGHGIYAESVVDEGTCVILDLARDRLGVE